MSAPSVPLIAFLTDYGRADPFVGLCHAVLAAHAPHARVVDLTHDIGPQGVAEGALVLADCMPHLPASVVLAVVDPGVGTDRRPIIVSAGPDPRLLVGPDNGLLLPAAERLGAVEGAWRIDVDAVPDVREPGEPRSRTFDGRDLFAPVAARLAAGGHPDELGTAIDPAELVSTAVPAGGFEMGVLRSPVLRCDHFGNVQLVAGVDDLDRAGWQPGQLLEVAVGGERASVVLASTFADVEVGELALLVDAFGRLQLSRRDGDAAAALAASAGEIVEVTSPSAPASG
jgi:S-adenosylmethionine hydrolase